MNEAQDREAEKKAESLTGDALLAYEKMIQKGKSPSAALSEARRAQVRPYMGVLAGVMAFVFVCAGLDCWEQGPATVLVVWFIALCCWMLAREAFKD